MGHPSKILTIICPKIKYYLRSILKLHLDFTFIYLSFYYCLTFHVAEASSHFEMEHCNTLLKNIVVRYQSIVFPCFFLKTI